MRAGCNGVTDADGEVVFTLPQGDYRFRSDRNGTQFWSGETDHCAIPGCTEASVTVTIPVKVTVQSETGSPYPDLPVYAFDGDSYTGYHGTSDANGQVSFTLPDGDYRFRADYDGVQFWSVGTNHCAIPGCLEALVEIPGGVGGPVSVTIDYTYDPLQRLVAADYSTGGFFHYSYDAVGNRLTQDTLAGTNTYDYDIANRLLEVDGVTYSWDDNGNLQDDGLREYAYDHANRLVSVEMGADSYEFGYNGLGDRLRQTVNGGPIEYTLDLAAGLTQVLSDGDNAYLYGVGRIGEQQPEGWQYHLGDALGSSRQLTDPAGDISLASTYAPYGDTLSGIGSGSSAHQFTGEMRDPSGLTFLRARYLDTAAGRFINRDKWRGEYTRPHSLNRWNYVEANPIMYVDPSGQICLDPWAPAGFHLDPTRGCDYPEGSWWRKLLSCPAQTPTLPPTPAPTPSRRFDQVIFICGRDRSPACASGSAPLYPFREMAERNGYSASDFSILDVDVCGTKLQCANEAISRIGAAGTARFLVIGHSAGGSAVIIAVDRVSDKGRIAGIVLLDPAMTAELEGGIETGLQTMADNLPKPLFLGDSPEDGDDRIAGALEVTYPDLGHNELAVSELVVEDVLDLFGWSELR